MHPPDPLVARHYLTRQPFLLRRSAPGWHPPEPTASAPTESLWFAPPLFDPQVNGFAGVDFQQDSLDAEQLLAATRSLRAHGCARILLTLVTDDWPRLLRRLQHLAQIRRTHPELTQRIAGWHVEGPFLSTEPGYHGAHDPAHMRAPTPELIRQLREAAGPDPLLLTLAPECPDALDAIRSATQAGIRISLGHTNTPVHTLHAAFQAGATLFTHLGNACPQQLDRHDNILWRVLDHPGFTVSLIPDGHHVSPQLFRILHRLLPAERIFYTTDAMSAAAAPPGCYPLGRLTLEVGSDGIVRQPGRTNFAGSALTPIDGVRRAATMLGLPWQAVWDGFSTRAPQALGLPPTPPSSGPADLCLLRDSDSLSSPILLE